MPHRYPLHDLHAEAGARFATTCDWEVPRSYGDVAAEYAAVRQGVGLVDRGDGGVVEATGRDRASFLHAMLTNDVNSLREGQGCRAALLDVHGKVQVLLGLLALEDRILVVTPPGMAPTTVEDLDRYLFSEKVVLSDVTAEHALLMLAGPDAPALVERATGAHPPEAPWSHVTATLGEATVRLVRGAGETGEAELWVIAPARTGAALWRAFVGAGARPIGTEAQEALRIEAGTPLWGHDVDASVLFPEIPIEALVSYTKGCYIGQEVVVRIRDRGHVNRLLRGLVLEGERVPMSGTRIAVGDADVGRVTSAAWSVGLKRPVALGFVRREHAEPGARVAVIVDGEAVPAAVSAPPLAR